MSYDHIQPEVIKAIQVAGFSVYMRNPTDTWCYFTDGKNIGYLQTDSLKGLSISTVHIPNCTSGTGYGLTEGRLRIEDISETVLRDAFILAPSWADQRSRASVVKWKDWETFSKANKWADYKLVEAE